MAHIFKFNSRKLVSKVQRVILNHAVKPPHLLYVSQGVRYRKLDVILTTNVENLGKSGEVVKVAPGYFRNYLMPKLLAVPNIDKFVNLIKEQQKMYQREEEVNEEHVVEEDKIVEDVMKEYKTAANRLDKKTLTIRAGVNAETFKTRKSKDDPIETHSPITKEVIIREVARQLNVEIDPSNLHLPEPLTEFGVFEVPLRLPMSIPLPEGKHQWSLKVKIRGK